MLFKRKDMLRQNLSEEKRYFNFFANNGVYGKNIPKFLGNAKIKRLSKELGYKDAKKINCGIRCLNESHIRSGFYQTHLYSSYF